MAMRVEALGKVPKRLDSNDRAGKSSGFRDGRLEETPQGIPTTTAEFCQQLSVMEEEAAEDLRYAQYEVPVGDRAKYVGAEPLAEFHDAFLMAGWAEVPSLAGEGQEPLGSAPIAPNPGKTVV
jgi:hypothetical protein